jgi:carbamate kinase
VAIAAGGGGVPVVRGANGRLEGIDAVVDKDWASAVLACAIDAKWLVILMEADAVYESWGTPDARRVAALDPDGADALARVLDPGGIGPKLAACAWFARSGGTAVICCASDLAGALLGKAGTHIS